MATVEQGLLAQIGASGQARHGEIVAWRKSEHGMTHGAANRVALVALATIRPTAAATDPEEALYPGAKRALLPVHAGLMNAVRSLGADIEVAPKKGYLSLRRRKPFAMIKPAAGHVDLGLVLPDRATDDRLELAATFNTLFTHRVRVRTVERIDPEVRAWLADAYARAGWPSAPERDESPLEWDEPLARARRGPGRRVIARPSSALRSMAPSPPTSPERRPRGPIRPAPGWPGRRAGPVRTPPRRS